MKRNGSTKFSFLESVTTAFKKLFGFNAKTKLFKGIHVDDFPDSLNQFTLYLANGGVSPCAAALNCPCGCGEVIQLNLLEAARPCWKVREHPKGLVSITPSVQRTKGCRSHFWLREGEIYWC